MAITVPLNTTEITSFTTTNSHCINTALTNCVQRQCRGIELLERHADRCLHPAVILAPILRIPRFDASIYL